jgi:hypothetical protein
VSIDLTPITDAQHQADLASRLLQNEAFNQAFADLMADIEKQLFMTDPSAREQRETLYHLHRASQMFVNNIASRINHLVLNESDD